VPWWQALAHLPFVYVNRWVSIYYGIRGMIVEWIGVPLGLTKGLTVFEKGH